MVLDFFLKKNPTYKYYWRIDHDVRFNGLWSKFFDYFIENDADFIATYIKKYSDDPEWVWWNKISIEIPISQQMGSYFPIVRFSSRSLKLLDEKYKSGIYGHSETIVPTLINLENFRIEDIGKKWYDEETFFPSNPPYGTIPRMQKRNKLSHSIR
jgi:hypothetical protein